MADCSTYEEGMHAEEIGFDLIGTTMSGYTDYTAGKSLPDITMMESLVGGLKKPVIAEGGHQAQRDNETFSDGLRQSIKEKGAG